MQHHEYEVVLSQRESLARIHAAERAIKRAGGRVMLKPSTATGLVLVTLVLPEPLTPKQFSPISPFTRCDRRKNQAEQCGGPAGNRTRIARGEKTDALLFFARACN